MSEVMEPNSNAPDPDRARRPWHQKKRFRIPLALLALVIIGNIFGSDDTGSSTTDRPTTSRRQVVPARTPDPTATPTAGIGQPARDGKFEFTVSKLECGPTTVGTNQYLQEQAQGQFCLLTVKIANVGNEPQTLFADNQYLTHGEQRFGADSQATWASNYQPDGTSNPFIEEINPGNAVEGVIVFDVPAGVTPTGAQLHDSAFSGGIAVNL